MRSSSCRFQRAATSPSRRRAPAGASRSASTSRAAGSASSSRVSDRLAAVTATSASASRASASRRASRPGTAVPETLDCHRHRAAARRTARRPSSGRTARFALPRARSGSRQGRARYSGASAAAVVTCDVPRIRVAAVPAQHGRRRPRRQRRAASSPPSTPPRPRAATWPSSPSWPSPATRPRTCCSSPASSPTTGPRSSKLAARTGRCAAVVGFVDAGRDLYNAAAVCAEGRGAGRLPQAAPAQLRGVRRAALLRARDRSAVSSFVIGGVRVGVVDLRGRLEPRRAHRRPGRRRGRADRQPQRLAVLRRAAGRAGAHARHPGRRRRRARSSTSTWSAARTSWSSTARRWCSTPTARSSPGPRSSSRRR